MLKKYISKFTIDILPSILATIVGAYIVNHYIIPKAGADKPAAAIASTPADTKPDSRAASAKPAENSADLANPPDATPAKASEKPASEKPAIEKASIDKPETATVPETRRHQPILREKAAAKAPPTQAPVLVAPAPVLATVGTAPAANASADERRDANDLARAAIERLNRSEPRSQDVVRAPETPRAPEPPRVQEVARSVSVPAMQQLPPPIMVTTPSVEKFDSMPSPQSERSEARRMRPPGEIPAPQPMDLQASAAASPRPERTNVAEDVLSAAKSVFNSVIPHPFDK